MNDQDNKFAIDLIDSLSSNPASFSGRDQNRLLDQFAKGLSVNRLRTLLLSPDEKVIRVGLFIADELSKSRVPPLANDITELMRHPNPQIRRLSYSLATKLETEASHLQLVRGLLDCDSDCRKLCTFLICRVPSAYLQDASHLLQRSGPEEMLWQGVEFLLSADSENEDQIMRWMQGATPLGKQIGVIAASRIASRRPAALEWASKTEEVEVKDCAIRQLRFLSFREGARGNKS